MASWATRLSGPANGLNGGATGVQQGYEAWFGAPNSVMHQNVGTPGSTLWRTSAEAWNGENITIRTRILTRSLAQQQWIWTVSPARRVPGRIEITYTTIFADPQGLGILPEHAAAKTVSAGSKTERARLVRRGLAMAIGTDFYMTPAGQEMFRLNIDTIASSINMTVYALVMARMLSLEDQYIIKGMQRGHQFSDLLDLLTYTKLNWGAFNKDPYAAQTLKTEADIAFGSKGIVPNFFVMPSKSMQLVVFQHPELHTQSIAGDSGPGRIMDKQAERVTLQGVQVYEARDEEIDRRASPAIPNFYRDSQTGGFEYLSVGYTEFQKKDRLYESGDRSIRIFSMRQNAYVLVTLLDCLIACGRFQNVGAVGTPGQSMGPLVPDHQYMIDRLPSLKQLLDGYGPGNQLFDVFVTQTFGDRRPAPGSNYAVIHWLGEMELFFFPLDKQAKASEIAERRLTAILSAADVATLETATRNIDRIFNAPVTAADLAALVAAAGRIPNFGAAPIVEGGLFGFPNLETGNAATALVRDGIPLGYGSWAGYMQISRTVAGGGGNGVNADIVANAAETVLVLNKLADAMREIFGSEHAFFSAAYLPAWLRSTDDRQNELLSFATNALGETRYPVFVRFDAVPALGDPREDNRNLPNTIPFDGFGDAAGAENWRNALNEFLGRITTPGVPEAAGAAPVATRAYQVAPAQANYVFGALSPEASALLRPLVAAGDDADFLVAANAVVVRLRDNIRGARVAGTQRTEAATWARFQPALAQFLTQVETEFEAAPERGGRILAGLVNGLARYAGADAAAARDYMNNVYQSLVSAAGSADSVADPWGADLVFQLANTNVFPVQDPLPGIAAQDAPNPDRLNARPYTFVNVRWVFPSAIFDSTDGRGLLAAIRPQNPFIPQWPVPVEVVGADYRVQGEMTSGHGGPMRFSAATHARAGQYGRQLAIPPAFSAKLTALSGAGLHTTNLATVNGIARFEVTDTDEIQVGGQRYRYGDGVGLPAHLFTLGSPFVRSHTGVGGTAITLAASTIVHSAMMQQRWLAAQEPSKSVLRRAYERMFCVSEVTGAQFARFIHSNMLLPCDFITARPGRTWRMGSIGYGRTGFMFTAIGGESFGMQTNPVRGIIVAQFTGNFGVIAADPDHFMLMRDVIIGGYQYGYEITWHDPDSTWDPRAPNFRERSIICMLTPYNSSKNLSNMIDLTGNIAFNKTGTRINYAPTGSHVNPKTPTHQSAYFYWVRYNMQELTGITEFANGRFQINTPAITTWLNRAAFFAKGADTEAYNELVQGDDVFGTAGPTPGSYNALRGAPVRLKPFLENEAATVR